MTRRTCLGDGLFICALLALLLPRSTHAGESDSSRVYGGWRWTESYHGTFALWGSFPEVCDCERYLSFGKDGTYEYVEQDSTNEYVLARGTFKVSRVTAEPSDGRLRYWLRLHPGLNGEEYANNYLIRHLEHDGLALVDCGEGGGIVIDGGSESFAREYPSRKTKATKPQLPLSKRPKRTDTAAEVDTSLTHAPVLLHHVSPAYPESLNDARIVGKVEVRALVGRDGRVKRVRSDGFAPTLDKLACDAVMHWTFRPYGSPSNPQPVWIRVVVDFPPASK